MSFVHPDGLGALGNDVLRLRGQIGLVVQWGGIGMEGCIYSSTSGCAIIPPLERRYGEMGYGYYLDYSGVMQEPSDDDLESTMVPQSFGLGAYATYDCFYDRTKDSWIAANIGYMDADKATYEMPGDDTPQACFTMDVTAIVCGVAHGGESEPGGVDTGKKWLWSDLTGPIAVPIIEEPLCIGAMVDCTVKFHLECIDQVSHWMATAVSQIGGDTRTLATDHCYELVSSDGWEISTEQASASASGGACMLKRTGDDLLATVAWLDPANFAKLISLSETSGQTPGDNPNLNLRVTYAAMLGNGRQFYRAMTVDLSS